MKPTNADVLKWAREIFDAQNWSDAQLARLKELTDRAAAYGSKSMQERAAKRCEEFNNSDYAAGDSPMPYEYAEAIRSLGDDE